MASTNRVRKTRKTRVPESPKSNRHLISLAISNFRGIRKLRIDGLAPLTIVTGDNGSGKSTLLEAAFAIHARTTPVWILNLQGRRGMTTIRRFGPTYLGLFYGSSDDGNAKIDSETQDGTRLRVEIERRVKSDRPILVEAGGDRPDDGSVAVENKELSQIAERSTIEVRAFRDDKLENRSELLWMFRPPDHTELQPRGAKASRPSALMQHPSDSTIEDADKARYGDLREAGQADAVLSLVRVIDPRVRDVEHLQTSRTEYFRAKLSDGRFLPLGMLGGGVVNAFRIGINLVTAQRGFLGIDEVENGLYYRRLPVIFERLVKFRKQLGVQLMLATHSREAVVALVKAAHTFDDDQFALVHLQRQTDDGIHATVLKGSEAWSSVEHGYELR